MDTADLCRHVVGSLRRSGLRDTGHDRDEVAVPAVRDYLAGYPDVYDVTGVPAVRVHRTGDPETVVAEFSAEGRTVRTGAPYRMDYIVVITVRDGWITEYRDYWSPVQAARAGGDLEALRKGLET